MFIDEYYDGMSGNYVIPKNEMTAEMFSEILEVIGEKNLTIEVDHNNNITNTEGYMLFLWNDGEEDFWVVSDWLV